VKRTIVHAYKLAPPDLGGITAVIDWLVQGLFDSFTFTLLACRSKGLGRVEDYHGIKTIRTTSFGLLFSTPLAPFYFMWFWWLALKADIVDHHYPMPWNDLAIALYFPKKTRLVIHWHSEIIEQKQFMWFFTPLIRRTLKRANAILISSPHLLEASEFLKEFASKVQIVPFGIDLQTFSNVSPSENQAILSLQKRYGKFVLSVGRLVTYKGYEYLIDAMKTLDHHLVIVGEGPLLQSLKDLSRDLKSDHKVHFFGAVSGEELKNLYHACELFVLASITPNEAFGLVQIEAMACGKPIVNTALNSGVPWVARKGIEAITVPPRNSVALTTAIAKILKDDDLRSDLGKAALLRAHEEFDRRVFLRRTAKIYEDV
jgi:rhamnosyl/mannosyltransferase